MPFEFTPNMKPFVVSSILDAVSSQKLEARKVSTTYAQGARVSNGNNGYIAINSGTTSAGAGPSNTSGLATDGTVQWLATGPVSGLDSAINSNIYLGIGKKVEWANPVAPDAVDSSDTGTSEVLEDLASLVALSAANFRLGIARNDWETGTVYAQYDPDQEGAYANPHYVIVADERIYKCLDNNGGANSTVPPAGTGSAVIELADGYIWKYVGSIASRNDYFRFTTENFVPCPTTNATSVVGSVSTFKDMISLATPFDDEDVILTDIIGDGTGASGTPRLNISGGQAAITGFFASALGSGYTEAWVVARKQGVTGTGATVEVDLLAGEVDAINVLTGGADYATASVVILGDGTGAEATAAITSGAVTSITVIDPGTGYTWARAFIIPGNQGAAARGVLAPANGHGSQLTSELNANTLLVSATLASALGEYIEADGGGVDGKFRQISLISNVKPHTGSTKNAEAYIGPQHHLYATPGSLNKYLRGSGFAVYVNNIVAVTHTALQEEIIKISITL